jgi:pyruvate, water dikinase
VLLWLTDAACADVGVAGGKGASLARMTQAGAAVPDGFVVGAGALAAALEAAGCRERVVSQLAAGADVREVVRSVAVPGELSELVGSAYAALGGSVAVAVRSSACAEDSAAASFAGQQETYLNVSGAAAVLDAVRACWASFFSERALFYRGRKGVATDLGMAVVVQRQLFPDKAGVLFTMDPVRRRRDQVVVEAVWGLGEALVSGRLTPDHYVLTREGTVKQARVASQPVAVVPLAGGGTEERALEPEQAEGRVLTDGELAELAALGVRLESHFGAPQDVEWAYESGRLHALQSRPITA